MTILEFMGGLAWNIGALLFLFGLLTFFVRGLEIPSDPFTTQGQLEERWFFEELKQRMGPK